MRITFVLPPVSMSGGIRVVAIYARILAERGHEVTVVSPPRQAMPLRRRLKLLATGKGWPTSKPQASHLDGLDIIHRVIERYRPIVDADIPDSDVVIATWWETAEWVNSLSSEKGAKVYFVQGHEIFPHCPKDRVIETYHMPLHKITISRWLVEIMKTNYMDDCVDLVPNSVDHSLFFAEPRSKQARPTVGFLFSPDWIKGVDICLAAVELARKVIPDLRVLSFGAVPPNSAIQLPEEIEFKLLPKQDSIRDIYASCDVWLCGSRTEGFHLPPAEAMACRTPVVSTKVGGPIDLITDGVNGFLVDIEDVPGLANGIFQVLSLSNQEWMALSNAAYETVAGYTWDEAATQFHDCLVRALERNSSM